MMLIFSPLPDNTAPGDRARRIARVSLLFALVLTPLTVWFFFSLGPILKYIAELKGVGGILSASVLWLVMAVAPVASAASWILAVWHGVQSVFKPKSRRTPIADFVIVCLGIVAWSLPTLGFLAKAIYSLATGRVHFSQPARDYLLSEDPIAYWQSIGFLFIAAAFFAWLAWRYWKGKSKRGARSKNRE